MVIIRKKILIVAVLFLVVLVVGAGQALIENEIEIPNLGENKNHIRQVVVREDKYDFSHLSDDDIKDYFQVAEKINLSIEDEGQEESEEDSRIEYIVAERKETKISSAPQKAEDNDSSKRQSTKARVANSSEQASNAEEARKAAEAKKAEEARKAAEAEEARKAAEAKEAEEAKKVAENKKTEEKKENPTSSKIAQIASLEEKEVVRYVNIEREKAGLNPLVYSAELSRVARDKSIDMAENKYFSHTSPTYGSPFQMMKSYGIKFKAAAENIASGQISARFVVESWMNSPGHRVNILNPDYNKIGVGFWTLELGRSPNFWTQLFTD